MAGLAIALWLAGPGTDPASQRASASWAALVGAARAAAPQPLVREVQSLLAERGYDPGPVDGLMGAATRAAILRYQRDHGLARDGLATAALRDHLLGRSLRGPAARAGRGGDAGRDERAGTPAELLRDAPLRASPSPRARVVTEAVTGSRGTLVELSGRWSLLRLADGAEGWTPTRDLRIGEPSGESTGGGATGWFRSLTSLLAPRRPPPRASGAITVGIRGLQAQDIQNARPDPRAVDALALFRASDEEARDHARRRRLTARRIGYLEPPAPAVQTNAPSADDRN